MGGAMTGNENLRAVSIDLVRRAKALAGIEVDE